MKQVKNEEIVTANGIRITGTSIDLKSIEKTVRKANVAYGKKLEARAEKQKEYFLRARERYEKALKSGKYSDGEVRKYS